MLGLVCVWSLLVLLEGRNLKSIKTLNYSLLNKQQTISLSLQSYFKVPSQVSVDLQNSSPQVNDVLGIQFTEKAVSQMSSLQLIAKMADNNTVDFSNLTVIMERSIFNYPNKVFLMNSNYVFSLRYQVSNSSDNISYVRAFKINTNLTCTNLEVQQFNSSYYVFVGCIKSTPNNSVVVYPFKYTEPKSGLLDELVSLPKADFKFSSPCFNITLYAFDQLYTTTLTQSKVILGCTTATRSNLQMFVLTIVDQKGVDYVLPKFIINDNLAYCFRESSKIIEYQKGFLAVTRSALNYYSYNPSSKTTACTTNFLNTTDSKFITSVKDGDIQYIYVIYKDKIIIKQSYSPNYGVVSVDQSLLTGMSVENYCVAQRFLGLLYRNNTHYGLLTFDLRTGYPKLVDIVFQSHNYSFAFLYSVKNFLSKGNYYLVYDSVQNILTLNCYIGYELTLTIKNSSLAAGSVALALTDQEDQLLLNFTFRDFKDVTLEKSSDIEQKMMFQNVLTLNLSSYVNGPLGRFYTYPNQQSLFQYVNYLCEFSVKNQLAKIKEKLKAISLNNVMSIPLITFFFQNTTILTCELDFSTIQRQAYLSQCKTKTRKSNITSSKNILVLSKQSFLQFDNQSIEMCELTPSGQYECFTQKFQKFNDLVGIKLVSYTITNVQERISFIIYCKKEILYSRLDRYYPNRYFSTSIYYHIVKDSLPELAKMSIIDLHFNTQYTNFLVLRFLSDDGLGQQKIVVYDRPYIRPNTTSTLIGHVIQTFQKIQLQALFCYDSLLILVTKQLEGFIIKEYKITKQYRLRFTRIYPLYSFTVKSGGRHFQDQNFIFLQSIEQNTAFYLVYAPLLPTCNILTHKIQIKGSQIYFAQQIGSIQNSSLMLNGENIVGITVPNFILRFINNNPLDTQLGVTLVDFNISVVDSLNTLSVLNYQFSYNEKEEQIKFLDQDVIQLTLNSSFSSTSFTIYAQDVHGFVQDYNFTLPDTPICNAFKMQRVDVFTKQQCLLYYQSQQYGTLNDFVVVQIDNKEVQVLVTDTRLFCVADKHLPNNFNPSFQNLSDCRFQSSNNQILMSCMNNTTLYRSIFNITVTYSNSSCEVLFFQIDIPEDIAYQDFDIQFNRDVIMLEVPIRMQQNKIYYKAQLQHTGITNNYSLLVKDTGNQIYQSQFQTVDSTLSSEVFLLLQDGIGVFNISDSKDVVLPALWIDSDKIQSIVGNEPFAYLMLLELQMKKEGGILLVQLGAAYRSFEIEIRFTISNTSSHEQTVYHLEGLQVALQYKQYLNCRNGISSYSQRFQNLIVKICNYEPKQQNVFANFISINKETSNSLIQFYNKSGNIVFPFRIEVIYSNPLSNHLFAISNNTLVVGSLFNMLCYYALTPTITWKITHNATGQGIDELCEANLTLFNKHKKISQKMTIFYDADSLQVQYWSVGIFYIQRVVLFLILANTIRLMIIKRKKVFNRTRRKESGRLHTSRFEVMVKINSKKSI